MAVETLLDIADAGVDMGRLAGSFVDAVQNRRLVKSKPAEHPPEPCRPLHALSAVKDHPSVHADPVPCKGCSGPIRQWKREPVRTVLYREIALQIEKP